MLTPSAVQNAKAQAKPYKLTDERGMYLWVRPDGAKWWRFDYRRPGTSKRNTLSLGTFPETTLKRAREKREEARALIADGIDPGVQRQVLRNVAAESFEAVAREWLTKQGHLSAVTLEKAVAMFEQMAFPWIGSRPIATITAPDLLSVVRRVEARGRIETAQRLKQRCGQVFRYAVATGRAERDPTADLRGALATVKVRHRAAITEPDKFGKLLRDLDTYSGSFIVACALRLAPLLFVRPGELRHAEWTEIDLEAAEWRIPAAKMKMRREHVVPLSTQAVAIRQRLERRHAAYAARDGADTQGTAAQAGRACLMTGEEKKS